MQGSSSKYTSVSAVTASANGQSARTQSVYRNSAPISSSIYETVIRFMAPPSGVNMPPLFAPQTIARSTSFAALLFSTSPSPTNLSIAIAMEHSTAATTVFGSTAESTVEIKNQITTCCLTEVPTSARLCAAMRLSTPVISQTMVMISAPASRNTSSAE